MAMMQHHAAVRVGAQGRLVIPVELRRSLGIKSGETLAARVEDGRLMLAIRPAEHR